jgi:glycosyltransferase involved in cell wall biosynthesis
VGWYWRAILKVMPRVSIIVPTYNGEHFIKRALQSALNQTFRDFEIMVVDDVSKDSTREKVEELALHDKRIKLMVLPKNSGGGAVPRTVGCKAAAGDLIAFLDQDDLYMPEYLGKKVAFFDSHPEINALSSSAWMFDEKTKKIIDCGGGGPVNVMVRKEVMPAVGYLKQSQTNVDDMGMWYRYDKIYGPGKSFLIEGGPLTLYSRHAGQGSDTAHGDPRVFIKRLDSILAEIDPNGHPDPRNRLSRLYSRKGNFYCLAGDFKTGRHFFLQSLRWEFNVFSLVLFAVSFSPRFYKTFEFSSRLFKLKVIAKARVFRERIKYEKSYQAARKILTAGLS